MIKKIILATFVLSFALTASPVIAAECTPVPWIYEATGHTVKDGLLIPCECLGEQTDSLKEAGSCNLNSVFQTIVNFSHLLVSLTGTAALLAIVYGGVMMIVAGTGVGDSQKNMDMGKNSIIAAAVGIAVVLGAWMIVNVTIIALTDGDVSSPAQIFGNKEFDSNPGQ